MSLDSYTRRMSWVPLEFADVTLENIEQFLQEKHPDFAGLTEEEKILHGHLTALLLPNRERSLWAVTVLGSVGNGKTTLACAAVNSYNEAHDCYMSGNYPLYCTASMMMETYKASGFDWQLLSKWYSSPLLVIDELRQAEFTDFSRNTLQKIIVERHANRRRTILIANHTPAGFTELFEQHVLSRLRTGATVVFSESDMRGRGR